jgi:hypothetical protein
MKHSEAKRLIRECLNEIIRGNPEGNRIIVWLVSRGIKPERWNVYEDDEKTAVIQLYFKLISQEGLKNILKLIEMHNGKIRMYPDKNLICVDLKIDKRMI